MLIGFDCAAMFHLSCTVCVGFDYFPLLLFFLSYPKECFSQASIVQAEDGKRQAEFILSPTMA